MDETQNKNVTLEFQVLAKRSPFSLTLPDDDFVNHLKMDEEFKGGSRKPFK